MTVVTIVCVVLLAGAAGCALARIERGPSMLDRAVAVDILLTAVIAAGALFAAEHHRKDLVPILVALSLVGFIGSVTFARFAAVEPEEQRRVRSREEVAAEAAERRRLDDEADRAALEAARERSRRAEETGGGDRLSPPAPQSPPAAGGEPPQPPTPGLDDGGGRA